MIGCHTVLGEGKLDFLGENSGKYCYMCSKIGFDDSLKGENLIGLGNYLNEKQVFGTDKTFMQLIWPNVYEPLPNEISMKDPFYIIYSILYYNFTGTLLFSNCRIKVRDRFYRRSFN